MYYYGTSRFSYSSALEQYRPVVCDVVLFGTTYDPRCKNGASNSAPESGVNMAVQKPRKQAPINRGRPPLARTQPVGLTSKATRTVITSHHILQKAHSQAVKDGDEAKARSLEADIAARGGLSKYQLASARGQSAERGGDSSRVLVEWLLLTFQKAHGQIERLRLLEIGALSTSNACSAVPCLEVKRIDLKSCELGIEEIDFMEMAVPEVGSKFHIISLSLVLNFVVDPAARGAMLARLPAFMEKYANEDWRPLLFLVLPLACVSNSRYLTQERLAGIMRVLGFQLTKLKMTSKLHYSLWTFDAERQNSKSLRFRKEELRSGGSRNNFAITLSTNA